MKSTPLIILAFGLFTTGCAASPPETFFKPHPSINKFGLTEADAKQKSVALYPGESSTDVIALLGLPDESSAATCGQELGKPWQCVTWKYIFNDGIADYEFLTTYQLEKNGAMTLNSWNWP